MGVVGQKGTDIAQLQTAVIAAVIPRQEQTAVAGEGWMVEEIHDRVIRGQWLALASAHLCLPHLADTAAGHDWFERLASGDNTSEQQRDGDVDEKGQRARSLIVVTRVVLLTAASALVAFGQPA